MNLEWSAGANALAVAGGLALLVGAFGALNVARARPFASIPRKVGLPELSAFVLLPVVLPLVFGGQVASAFVTGLANLGLLGLIWLVVGFSVISILRWTGTRFVQQLGASLTLLVKALPLLLFFSLVTVRGTGRVPQAVRGSRRSGTIRSPPRGRRVTTACVCTG